MINKIIKAKVWKTGKKHITNGITLTLRDIDKTERRLFISSIIITKILEHYAEQSKETNVYYTSSKIFNNILKTKKN